MVAPGAQTNLIPGGPSNAVFAAGANTAVAANNMSATNMFNPLSAGGQAQLNGMAAGAQLNPQCLAGLNPFAVNPFSPSATGLNPFASGLNPFAAMPGMPYGAQPGMPEGAAYDFFGMGGDYLLPGAELEKTA
ncbi:unnamed protein product [Amoebophrya sp. A25]|nr:unnamed protein product [Amoebophrya sp. A25]|eukprot:GSA25T00018621001.1